MVIFENISNEDKKDNSMPSLCIIIIKICFLSMQNINNKKRKNILGCYLLNCNKLNAKNLQKSAYLQFVIQKERRESINQRDTKP